MKKKKRKLPTKRQIKDFWKHDLILLKPYQFHSIEQIERGDYCFACGLLNHNRTERAHILARREGGPDHVGNLHLLCSICHLKSELLYGAAYNDWFLKRTHLDTMADILFKADLLFHKTFLREVEKGLPDYYSLDNLNLIRQQILLDQDHDPETTDDS